MPGASVVSSIVSVVAALEPPELRLNSCSIAAEQLLCGSWDLPRPGIEPVSPAVADRVLSLSYQGSPLICLLKMQAGSVEGRERDGVQRALLGRCHVGQLGEE